MMGHTPCRTCPREFRTCTKNYGFVANAHIYSVANAHTQIRGVVSARLQNVEKSAKLTKNFTKFITQKLDELL